MGVNVLRRGGQKKQKKERTRKPDELLSSVVRETAVPAAVEVMRSNAPFAFPSDTAWVILVLEAEAIGGLSRRHSRNEDKGSIIALIESDQIQTVATADMLAGEVFGIIPTSSTLDRMQEYSLLVNARYRWAVAYQNADQGLTIDLIDNDDDGSAGQFQQALAVAQDSLPLRSVVGDEAWARHSGAVDAAAEVDTQAIDAVPDAAEATAPADDDLAGDGLFDSDPLTADGAESDESFPEFSDSLDEDEPPYLDEASFDEATEFDDAPGEVLPEDADELIDDEDTIDNGDDDDDVLVADQDDVKASLARRFLSSDLDLQITLDEFISSFSIGTPVVQIDVPEGVGEWLGDQVAQLTRQANAELARLHESGEAELQSQFVNLMGLHCDEVIKAVAIDRPGSIYGELEARATRKHQERDAEKGERIRKRHAEIAEAYAAAAKEYGQQAAKQAELQYKERNSGKMQREQIDAAAAIEAEIENSHTYDQDEILRLRRKDAMQRMFMGQSQVFNVLREQQKKNFEAERELLEKWSADIQRMIDSHRKDDISRMEVLAEEHSRTDQITALKAEHADVVEQMQTELNDRVHRMEEELKRTRESAIEQMNVRDSDWQHALDLEKNRTDAESRRADDLRMQMEGMSALFDEQLQKHTTELQADRDRYINELNLTTAMAQRNSKLFTPLLVSACLVMLVVGVIIGAITL